MKKRWLLFILLLLLPSLTLSEEREPPEELSAILSALDLSEWDRWAERNDPELGFVPSDFLQTALLSGSAEPSAETLYGRIRSTVMRHAAAALRKLMLYLGIGVLFSLFSAIRPDSGFQPPETVLRLLSGCFVMSMSLPVLSETRSLLITIGTDAEYLLPPLLGFFALFDFSASGALLRPGMLLLNDGMIALVIKLVFPLAVIGGVLHAADCFSDRRLGSLGQFCHRAAKWLLGAGTSLYLAVAALRGTVAVQSDTLLFRTTKLAAGSLPFVGGIVSGSMDTLLQCVMSVRAALGLTGIVLIGGVMLRPLLRLITERIALQLCAALIAPLGVQAYAETLEHTADLFRIASASLLMVFVLAAVSVGLVTGVWYSI